MMGAENDPALFRAVVDAAGEAIMVTGTELAAPGPRITYVNAAFCRMTGYAPEEVIGQSPRILQGARTEATVLARMRASLAAGEPFQGDLVNYRRGGEEYITDLLISPMRDGGGRLLRWLAMARDVTGARRAEEALREETRTLEILNRIGAQLSAELDLEKLVQAVTDAATSLSGARFGAFFHAGPDEAQRKLTPYVLAGVPPGAFGGLPLPRATALFDPTLRGGGVIRSDDITADPRYGRNRPFGGIPPGHLPLRSYLATAVVSRTGTVLGTMFFGHPEPGVFTERAGRLVAGIAGHAAVAIDNARLHAAAQADIAERARAAARQEMLLRELDHRVNNTLSIVQSLAMQTLRTGERPQDQLAAFQGRLLALSRTHALLTRESWSGASLRDLVAAGLAPCQEGEGRRLRIEGEEARLPAAISVVLGMALHELATNAARHGALSVPEGRVLVSWRHEAGNPRRLRLHWEESGGPPLADPPGRSGFGIRLLQRSLARQLQGEVALRFAPEGLVCEILLPLPEQVSQEG